MNLPELDEVFGSLGLLESDMSSASSSAFLFALTVAGVLSKFDSLQNMWKLNQFKRK